MKPKVSYEKCEAQAEIIKALSHPVRLFLVRQLVDGERCVCELSAPTRLDVSTISRHLSYLKQVGVLEDEKRGQQVYYRLQCPCVLRFLDCIDEVIERQARRRLSAIDKG
jgi:ArsR family transcriptional regulator